MFIPFRYGGRGTIVTMELRHLRYFVAAAETLNITEAAKHLHVIVPPLSRMPSSRASDRHRMVPSCPNDRATSREEYPDRDHQSAGARIGLDPDIDWNTVFCRIPDRKPI